MLPTIIITSVQALNALTWIINILESEQCRYQITGGLAAKCYGSDRPLADIDIDIPNKSFEIILPKIKPFLTYGPERYQNDVWDILLATLDYQGQIIDLSGADDGCIFDKSSQQWVLCDVNFSTATDAEINNINVKVIEKSSLIQYKNYLSRAVDLEDIASIQYIPFTAKS